MSSNSNAVLWNSWALSQWVYPFHAPAAPANALVSSRQPDAFASSTGGSWPAANGNGQRAEQRVPSPHDALQRILYESCYLLAAYWYATVALNFPHERPAGDGRWHLHGAYFGEVGAEALPRGAVVGAQGGSLFPDR